MKTISGGPESKCDECGGQGHVGVDGLYHFVLFLNDDLPDNQYDDDGHWVCYNCICRCSEMLRFKELFI